MEGSDTARGFKISTEDAEYRDWPGKGHEFWFKGTRENTGGVFSLTESASAGEAWVAPHIHDEHDEGQYVLEGEYRFEMYGEEIVAHAGDFIFIPRGVEHSFAVGKQGGRCLTMFVPGGYEVVFREISEAINEGKVNPWEWGPIALEHGTRFLGKPHLKPGEAEEGE